HDGIMVLPETAKVGTPASEYFHVENDTAIEIDITPNRIDGASHIGAARDVAAVKGIKYIIPKAEIVENPKNEVKVDVKIENSDSCYRYMGVCLTDVKVQESPEWLKNRLKSVGLNPINNIVDVTNFVLFETGNPLHAFDADKIEGKQIIVKNVAAGTKFVTLDGVERELAATDLMICNAKEPMCIGGVFGGLKSGISAETKNVFLEAAYFSPVSIRKTSKYHGLKTDASFHFERGVDINMLPYALRRAASLIVEMGCGRIASEITDVYPHKIENAIVNYNINRGNALIGKEIPENRIREILSLLDIKVLEENGADLKLEIPSYRVDVTGEADVVEDIMRIYGYNNIEIPTRISLSINNAERPEPQKMMNLVSDVLTGAGYTEIMCLSMVSADDIAENSEYADRIVKIYNPLSRELNVMRPSLLYGGLNSIKSNLNYRNGDLKFFEFGRAYYYDSKKQVSDISAYSETQYLGIWITGKRNPLNWNLKDNPTDYFMLKSAVSMVLRKIGIDASKLKFDIASDEKFSTYQSFKLNDKEIARVAVVSKALLKKMDIDQDVFYAEINWDLLLSYARQHKIQYQPISKFPRVRRDLALLIDKGTSYKQLEDIAYKTEPKHIVGVNLFDVYEGKNIEPGKISYALSFELEDTEKTMTDKQIDKIMQKLIMFYEKELGAKVR
ncbi:MAG: phenylalanine--tRNA ligase subunit beta, partial [Bacteroidales bacterium]|nr:phenylalanine--tRNA ligase subunit beta [Bacteroidales bacterium]